MKRLNKKLLFFTVILILLCSVCLFFILCVDKRSDKEAWIYIDGRIYKYFSLSDDISEYTIETQYGYNKIEIRDGRIGITEADCPDKTCVKTGFTDNSNHPVICMPHRLEIVIADSSVLDGVTG